MHRDEYVLGMCNDLRPMCFLTAVMVVLTGSARCQIRRDLSSTLEQACDLDETRICDRRRRSRTGSPCRWKSCHVPLDADSHHCRSRPRPRSGRPYWIAYLGQPEIPHECLYVLATDGLERSTDRWRRCATLSAICSSTPLVEIACHAVLRISGTTTSMLTV